MAEVVLFHHAQGLTDGVLAFGGELRAAGHVVHTPDLFEGHTFAELADGMAFVEELGFGTVLERGAKAASQLPAEVVHIGFSLGVMPAQMVAQTRTGARGAVLLHAAVPPTEFGGAWPDDVPLQIHVMEGDELGDVVVGRMLADTVAGAELFLYPGDRHLFTDSSLPAYDADATALVLERVRAFLDAAA